MKIFSTFLLVCLVAFPAVMLQSSNGVAYAQEDEVIEDADVASEDEALEDAATEETLAEAAAEAEDEEEDDGILKKSPDAATQLLFVKPDDSGNLAAGSIANVLVGFKNTGKSNFHVNAMEASFRYPQDFNYFIQNFTAVKFDKVVEPARQASFEYSFIPSENFNGRPFGLVISLHYQDAEGKSFMDSVFNETVNITDPVEGFDSEIFFLYVTLAALALLLCVVLQQTLFSSASKRLTSSKPKVEMGTQNNGDIDYDWIPKEHLTRRTSPRRRGNKSDSAGSAASGSGSE